ncbi:L-threonine 3-dehydrogenase [Sneathiella sp. P13V-1]|uniref:L-threonine 3-dehydrogenase n=1 Tax=Sneathiella sp. P13V-1 TaxID=2697366 RepID=UPI00187B98D6|nr:L-threonine 3-dehydrogenase [Sneathiella sp. P13V-1]MBE7637817.1 L-threonine 3-dehydrogenase [Sneathiella sp. P13V-1]
MFAIAKSKAERGVWSVDEPELQKPEPGMVMVDVIAAGICGTDYHIYSWDQWSSGRIKTPMVIGHEFVGVISAIGDGVEGYEIGERVSAECHIACGTCALCRSGNAHICEKTEIIGVDRPGIFAEKAIIPASNLWKVPDAIPDHHAAVFDPVGNAMHMVASADVRAKNVLIVGGGPIGLFAAAIAKSHGARTVTLQEPNQARAAIASELDLDLVVNPRHENSKSDILDLTDGRGPDAVLEVSGNGAALNAALDIAAPGATVALLGIPGGPVELDLGGKVVMKGIRLLGVTGRRMYETWFQVEAFMLKNPDLIEKVITHRLPARQFEKGFHLMDEGACGKVVLEFGHGALGEVA